jgi:hypothetical protein
MSVKKLQSMYAFIRSRLSYLATDGGCFAAVAVCKQHEHTALQPSRRCQEATLNQPGVN